MAQSELAVAVHDDIETWIASATALRGKQPFRAIETALVGGHDQRLMQGKVQGHGRVPNPGIVLLRLLKDPKCRRQTTATVP